MRDKELDGKSWHLLHKAQILCVQLFNPSRGWIFAKFGMHSLCPSNVTIKVLKPTGPITEARRAYSFAQHLIGQHTHTVAQQSGLSL